ncbi:response regulator [Acidicapsa dinghuensis]|uniref:Response regulator n=1 Tax=Acidicapsa dinghuensis TaxID=2218256 RepID=A0ABW1EEN2_9BACT|nr:response regulator [Acidicapsa dinghuensis]
MSELHDRRRVFVVDDESIIAVTLATILQKNGYNAISYTDPAKALTAIHENPPDLLITDVMMPRLSGVDLAIAVRKSFPKCKILLFSGQAATVGLLQEASENGHAFDLITKPIHPTDLLERIRVVTEETTA